MKSGSTKEATRYFICGNAQEVKCPFCGYLVERTNSVQYCAGCGAVYKVRKSGVFPNVYVLVLLKFKKTLVA